MMYRIAVVEDMPRALTALATEIGRTLRAEVVLTALNGKEYLEKLEHLHRDKHPHVALIDLHMPVMNGIETVRVANQIYPAIHSVMMTVAEEYDDLFDALRAGAKGYLMKEQRIADVMEMIALLMDGERPPLPPVIARMALQTLLKSKYLSPLCRREVEILEKLMEGWEVRKIATYLLISPKAVKSHITQIYEKLNRSSKITVINWKQLFRRVLGEPGNTLTPA